MKYAIIVLMFLWLLVLMTGCTPHAAFVRQVDSHTRLILPEYQVYLAADPALDATSKRIRTQSVQALRDLIETAKVEAGVDAN